MKRYNEGGLEEALDNPYEKKRKPLPSETVKEDTVAKERNEKIGKVLTGETQRGAISDFVSSTAKRLKENIMGTDQQNDAAKARMAKEDAKSPDTMQAKVNRFINKEEPVKKRAGGSVSSASKRADGCAVKGKTKGRMV